MLQAFQNSLYELITPEEYVPHGFCLLWDPKVLFLHIGSDIVIAAAYLAIPLALLQITRERKDLLFRPAFHLFSAFIFFCGATHVVAVWVLWSADYQFEGIVKLLTAFISVASAAYLWRELPNIRKFPTTRELELVNARLELALADREQAVAELIEREERARDIAEIASDWEWETDEQLRVKPYSPRAQETIRAKMN